MNDRSSPARNIRDGAFCWQSKSARRLIRDVSDSTGNTATALAVYDALTEIASDRQSETFAVSQATIAKAAGVSDRWVRAMLPKLVDIGLVSITPNKLPGTKAQLPSTFRLLKCSYSTSGSELRTSGNDFPGLEQSLEESPEQGEKAGLISRHAKHSPAATVPDEVWVESLKSDQAFAGIDIDRELAKAKRWCIENQKQLTRRRFVNWLNRADRAFDGACATATGVVTVN
jgi:hypothetical protein